MLRRHRKASLYWVCTCLNMPPMDMVCHCVEICTSGQNTTRKNAISIFFSRMWCKVPQQLGLLSHQWDRSLASGKPYLLCHGSSNKE